MATSHFLHAFNCMTSVVYHIFENCAEYEYCYENCDSADDPFYSDTTPKHDTTNDLSQITIHTPNPRIQRPGITQRLKEIINDHRTTYVDSQHQDHKQTLIFIFPCPVMPQYVYLGRLSLPKSPFMNFTTVTITSPLTPINLSNRPLFGIQGGILTL